MLASKSNTKYILKKMLVARQALIHLDFRTILKTDMDCNKNIKHFLLASSTNTKKNRLFYIIGL